MKPKDSETICMHCGGHILVDADACPYCGMPIFSDSQVPTSVSSQSSSDKDLSSLYAPPYSSSDYSSGLASPPKADGGFKPTQASKDNPFEEVHRASESLEKSPPTEDKKEFLSLLFILLGSNLLTIGLMQALFSEGGFLRLEWSSKYWMYYCLAAVPLIALGIKQIKQVEQPSKNK